MGPEKEAGAVTTPRRPGQDFHCSCRSIRSVRCFGEKLSASLRNATGETPTRAVKRRVKLPRLSNPRSKQTSVTLRLVSRRRFLASSIRSEERKRPGGRPVALRKLRRKCQEVRPASRARSFRDGGVSRRRRMVSIERTARASKTGSGEASVRTASSVPPSCEPAISPSLPSIAPCPAKGWSEQKKNRTGVDLERIGAGHPDRFRTKKPIAPPREGRILLPSLDNCRENGSDYPIGPNFRRPLLCPIPIPEAFR